MLHLGHSGLKDEQKNLSMSALQKSQHVFACSNLYTHGPILSLCWSFVGA